MDLFKLFGKIAIQNDEANEQIDETTDNAEESGKKMNDTFKKIGLAIAGAFAVDKLIDFGKEIVGLSAEVSAERSSFEQIMGDYSDVAKEKLGKVADEVGAVDTRLQPFMTSMTAKFKGLGYGVEDATDMASRGLTLASDASAFWDKTTEEAMGSLNSFINGSYEGGEAIGLFANDSQLASYAVKEGLVSEAKEWANLEESKKQATRLSYAEDMMKASGAVGQASKEAGQYANVQANLNEKWRQFKAQIGEPLLENVVLPAMEKVSGAVDVLAGFVSNVKQNWSEWETPLTIIGVLLGALTTAVIAYNVAQQWSAIVTAVYTMATTAWGAVMAFVTSPITLVILAIGALIAIGILLYKNWDEISAKAKEIWNKIKETISTAVENAKIKVSETFDKIKTAIMTPINEAKNTVETVFEKIKEKITTTIETARDKVKGAIDKIKEFFNFTWSFPKLKLPKVSITGGFSLSPPSVPKFSIDWFAKGGVLTKPTMFDYNPTTGKAKVGGEAGAEAVAPIDVLMGYVRSAVQEENAGMMNGLDRLISMLASYFPQILDGMERDVVLNDGALVGRLAPKLDAKLGEIYKGKGRGR